MPWVNGRMEYWWNWSARDPKTGKLQTFCTNGFAHVVTRDQCYAHARTFFPHLDMRDFSCELTDKLPQNKRECVPKQYRMDTRQQELLAELNGRQVINPASRSILHGKPIGQSEERGLRPPDGKLRLVPILQRQRKPG